MTGIYSFTSGSDVIYVGQSIDCFVRASTHFGDGRFKGCNFHVHNLMPEVSGRGYSVREIKRILDFKEACAISKLTPPENKVNPSDDAIYSMLMKCPIDFIREQISKLPDITK